MSSGSKSVGMRLFAMTHASHRLELPSALRGARLKPARIGA